MPPPHCFASSRSIVFHAVTAALCLSQALHAQRRNPPASLPSHPVAGTIRFCGSPQMGDLLALYETRFQQLHPNVQFTNDLQSTITAVAGVSSGQADVGLLGREIWTSETDTYTASTRHAPTVLEVATGSYDVPKATFALMVFIPAANPLRSLSLPQLQRIFADGPRSVHTWGELGLRGPWAQRPIHLYGFERSNDKSIIFRQLVFDPGDQWSPGLHEFRNGKPPDATDAGQLILNAVAADPDAIGISNTHYATPAVRAISLRDGAHTPPIPPSRTAVAARLYPLSRAVFFVIDGPSRSPATNEFLHFVLSREGQRIVEREGNYLPLPAAIVQLQLHALDRAAAPAR